MKFALVEDQVMFRSLLRRLLVADCAGEILFEAGTIAEASKRIEELRGVDLLLLDIRLPDGDGIEFLSKLTAARINVPVLLLSSSCEDYTVHRVSRSCAQGFVHKDDKPEILVMAIQMVMSGGLYFSPRYRAALQRMGTETNSFEKILSKREQEMLGYFGQGYSDGEIAPLLGLSVKTVGTHRSNVMTKLGVHTAQELTALALKLGFTTVDQL